jgi:uncharacterized protein (DUF1697 family)
LPEQNQVSMFSKKLLSVGATTRDWNTVSKLKEMAQA